MKKSRIEIPQQKSTAIDILLGRAAMLGFIFSFASYLVVEIVAPGVI